MTRQTSHEECGDVPLLTRSRLKRRKRNADTISLHEARDEEIQIEWRNLTALWREPTTTIASSREQPSS